MAKLGKATIELQGTFADADRGSQIVAYRKVVAKNYHLTAPDEISQKLGLPLLISTKIDGELWFLLHENEWKLVSPSGRTITGDLEILHEVTKAGLAKDVILAGELYVKSEGRSRIADVTSALGQGDKAETSKLAFGVFDIVASETLSAIGTPYSVRYEFISQLPTGTNFHHVASTKTTSAAEVSEIFGREVTSGGHEGLVARSDDGRSFKVKPTKELDAAILGFTERRLEDGSLAVRSLLFGVLQDDGSWIPISTSGNVGDSQFRKDLHLQLAAMIRPSSYRRISESSGVMYQLVEPQLVAELKCMDMQLEDLNGRPIKHPRLSFDAQGWKVAGWTTSAAIHNSVLVRLRTDKTVNQEDVGWSQVTRQLPIAQESEELTLGTSEVIRRAVWTKEGAGKTDVRKLLVWKTNKVSAGYSAYVVHWTDYSSTRKSPLDREVRLAPTAVDAEKIAEAMIADNIKKGWNLVS
jgi:ATP dependent DNA ligase domain